MQAGRGRGVVARGRAGGPPVRGAAANRAGRGGAAGVRGAARAPVRGATRAKASLQGKSDETTTSSTSYCNSSVSNGIDEYMYVLHYTTTHTHHM